MVRLTRAEHLRMEANKKKPVQSGSKPVDFYDTDLLEKNKDEKSSEVKNHKPEDLHTAEEQENEHEFHESFCS